MRPIPLGALRGIRGPPGRPPGAFQCRALSEARPLPGGPGGGGQGRESPRPSPPGRAAWRSRSQPGGLEQGPHLSGPQFPSEEHKNADSDSTHLAEPCWGQIRGCKRRVTKSLARGQPVCVCRPSLSHRLPCGPTPPQWGRPLPAPRPCLHPKAHCSSELPRLLASVLLGQ